MIESVKDFYNFKLESPLLEAKMAKPFPVWLQDQLDERDWKQADLVRATGGRLRAQTVSKWLAGKGLPPELPSIELVSQAFGLSLEVVVRAVREEDPRDGERTSSRSIDELLREALINQPVPIPVVQNVTASMGIGVPVEEYVYLPPRFRQNRQSIQAVKAKGTCMEPQILEGDFVVFDTHAKWDVGNIVVAVVQGETYVKRLARVGGKTVLRGDADGSIVSLEDAEKDEGVVGRVIQITRPLDDRFL